MHRLEDNLFHHSHRILRSNLDMVNLVQVNIQDMDNLFHHNHRILRSNLDMVNLVQVNL